MRIKISILTTLRDCLKVKWDKVGGSDLINISKMLHKMLLSSQFTRKLRTSMFQQWLLFWLNILTSPWSSSVSARSKLQGLMRAHVPCVYVCVYVCMHCASVKWIPAGNQTLRERKQERNEGLTTVSEDSDLLFGHGLLVLSLHHIQLGLLVIQLGLGLLQILHGHHVAVLLHHQVVLHRTHTAWRDRQQPRRPARWIWELREVQATPFLCSLGAFLNYIIKAKSSCELDMFVSRWL